MSSHQNRRGWARGGRSKEDPAGQSGGLRAGRQFQPLGDICCRFAADAAVDDHRYNWLLQLAADRIMPSARARSRARRPRFHTDALPAHGPRQVTTRRRHNSRKPRPRDLRGQRAAGGTMLPNVATNVISFSIPLDTTNWPHGLTAMRPTATCPIPR
jgi:hypothetical protein